MWRCATIYVDRLLVHVCSYKVPRRPFESARLDAELKVRAFLEPFGHMMEVRYSWKFDRQLAGEYGLRNKREIWRISLILSKIRRAARELLKLDAKDPKRLFEGAGGALFSLYSHNPFHSLFAFNVPFCRHLDCALRVLESHMLFPGNALIRRLVRIGVLDESRMRLDYVLALKIEDFLERRLQTQVFKAGLSKSIHHARVLIRQGHMR